MGSWLQAVPEDLLFGQEIHCVQHKAALAVCVGRCLHPEAAQQTRWLCWAAGPTVLGAVACLCDAFLINSLSKHQEACLVAGRALNL